VQALSMICMTCQPRTKKASAKSWRWHCHGRASAHMKAVRSLTAMGSYFAHDLGELRCQHEVSVGAKRAHRASRY